MILKYLQKKRTKMNQQVARNDAIEKIRETYVMNQILIARKPLVLDQTANNDCISWRGQQIFNPRIILNNVDVQNHFVKHGKNDSLNNAILKESETSRFCSLLQLSDGLKSKTRSKNDLNEMESNKLNKSLSRSRSPSRKSRSPLSSHAIVNTGSRSHKSFDLFNNKISNPTDKSRSQSSLESLLEDLKHVVIMI